MKYKILLTSTAIYAVGLSALAAVPCEWSATPQRPAPAQFDRFHGESLDFRCTFTGFGALPFAGVSDVRLWYQTNGMGAAWWSIPATVSSNALAATFPPSADPGAERLAVFFGAPSNAYAAAQVRFRNSPGALPNVLPPPETLDWVSALAAVSNAICGEIGSATNALAADFSGRVAVLGDRIAAAHLAATSAVPGIVTNEVTAGWSEWTFDPPDYFGQPIINVSDLVNCITPGFDNDGVEEDIGGVKEFGSETDTLSWTEEVDASINITATRQRITRNALGLAYERDVPGVVSNVVTKAYVEGLGIEAGISEATVTNVVRSIAYAVNDYVWDGDVCWRRQMLPGGYLEYVAVTNIDVTLPENYAALEALEKSRRNQE